MNIKSYMLYRIVPFPMTLSDPLTPVSRSQYSIKGEYFANGASDPLHVWFYARVFGIGGSNGAMCGSIKSKMAANAILDMQKWP